LRVEAWLPDPSCSQARVDALVAEVRDDKDVPMSLEPLRRVDSPDHQPKQILAELASIIGRRLAGDAITVANFAPELQGLDLLAQTLEALSSDTGKRRPWTTVSACRDLVSRLNGAAADIR
jgi:hypothetical protein